MIEDKDRDFILDTIKQKYKNNNNTFKKYFDTIEATENNEPSWFGFPIICKSEINRNELVKYLENNKVGTRLLFGGNIVNQPAYKNLQYKIPGKLNNSNIVKDNFFWIGAHPNINNHHHINYFLEIIEKGILEQIKK